MLAAIPDRPISFEVFSDEFEEMERQAREIATWGEHVYVKIPVTNTKRAPAYDLIHRLSHSGVKVNVTAILTLEQVAKRRGGTHGRRAVQRVGICRAHRRHRPRSGAAHDRGRRHPWRRAEAELIWASPRELLNIFQADAIGCHIITVTHDILKKLSLVGKSLDDYSLDTVKMFYDDARAAGFSLNVVSTT